MFFISITIVIVSACGQVASRSVPIVDLGYTAFEPPRDAAYQVQPGDTLYAIAWRYNLRVEDLVRFNKISSSNKIGAGQWLRLRAPRAGEGEPVAKLNPSVKNSSPAASESAIKLEKDRLDVSNGPPCCLDRKSVV